MKLQLFEARTAGQRYGNWGKFAVGRWGPEEWDWTSAMPREEYDEYGLEHGLPPVALLKEIGWWSPRHIWVLDLQTGEGGIFSHGGYAPADLERRQLWVCPLFEPFLTWLYKQPLAELETLPRLVELDAPFALQGFRRIGRRLLLPVLRGPGVCYGPNLI